MGGWGRGGGSEVIVSPIREPSLHSAEEETLIYVRMRGSSPPYVEAAGTVKTHPPTGQHQCSWIPPPAAVVSLHSAADVRILRQSQEMQSLHTYSSTAVFSNSIITSEHAQLIKIHTATCDFLKDAPLSAQRLSGEVRGRNLSVCAHYPVFLTSRMTTHSPDLQWLLIRNSSSFLVRRKYAKANTFTTVRSFSHLPSFLHQVYFTISSGTEQPDRQELVEV